MRNYQKELDAILAKLKGNGAPRLLLHSCCAPCSSYVLAYLRRYFQITVFFYNPNISAKAEYEKRLAEQKRLIDAYNRGEGYKTALMEGAYEPDCFYEAVKGMEDCPEGGERCFACYRLRLAKTAAAAKAGEFAYFATTLTVSPLKNAGKLNAIGEELAKGQGIMWLPSDFKKKGGYQQSVALSREYGLYRQNYCGCIYSQ